VADEGIETRRGAYTRQGSDGMCDKTPKAVGTPALRRFLTAVTAPVVTMLGFVVTPPITTGSLAAPPPCRTSGLLRRLESFEGT
jgi:hypothetical protein